MLKRNSKVLAIVMTIALCVTCMAPAFVAPQAALASSSYSVIRTQSVSNVGDRLTDVKIQVDIANIASLKTGDLVTIHMPSDIQMTNNVAGDDKQAGYVSPDVVFSSATATTNLAVDESVSPATVGLPAAPVGTPDVSVIAPTVMNGTTETNGLNYASAAAPSFVAYPVSNSAIEIKIVNDAKFLAAGTVGRLYVNLLNVLVNNTFDGDITATIAAPDNSGFSSGSLVFATYVGSGGGTTTIPKSVVTMGTAAKALDAIMIQETAKNTLKAKDKITLKLPNGFKWTSKDSIDPAWGFTSSMSSISLANVDITSDTRKADITIPAGYVSSTSEGRIYFYGTIEVEDEDAAKLGDVVVHVSGDDVTTQDITVATYAEYGVSVSDKTTESVVAGQDDTNLGSFNIAENMTGSLVPGRVVTFTLPSGVKWDTVNYTPSTCFTAKTIKGTDWASASTVSINSDRTQLKFSLASAAMSKSSLDFKDLKVAISPNFTGDINCVVAGTAGADGTVKVGTAVAPITLKASAPSNIVIGTQNQAIGDILITEGAAEAINAKAGAKDIILTLPEGALFNALPTVTVTAGDLLIDKVAYGTSKKSIDIVTKSTSSTASTIKLSGIKVTADRSVPEGDFVLTVDKTSTALTNQAAIFTFDSITDAVIGQCVTPAPTSGTAGSVSGQFKIDSNIYYIDGVASVMDAAPYIKAGRTYVPLRYVGLALGVADSDIVWDATAQTATLTLGSTVEVFTIGSTTYTVNGEAKTMDVAPEITNGRTMLPARYVAEGLGYNVGWDASTGTVLVSK